MENLLFFIPLFFVVLLVFPLKIKIKLAINILQKNAVICIYLWKIKLHTFEFVFEGAKLYIKKKKKKDTIKFSVSLKQMYFMEQLVDALKSKIRPAFLGIYSKVGLVDACQTASMAGTIICFAKSAFCYVKNKKPTCSMDCLVFPDYKKNVFVICAKVCFFVTIFDIVYSLIISLFDLRRRVYERKQSKQY